MVFESVNGILVILYHSLTVRLRLDKGSETLRAAVSVLHELGMTPIAAKSLVYEHASCLCKKFDLDLDIGRYCAFRLSLR